jgi:hypothetical protein
MQDAIHIRENEELHHDTITALIGMLDGLMDDYSAAFRRIKSLEEDLAWMFYLYPEIASDARFKSRYSELGAKPGVDAPAAPVYVPRESPDAPATSTRTKTGE